MKKVDKIKESEGFYKEIFENAIDAIFIADAKTGILIDCNSAASKLVGRKRSEMIGKHQRILHPKEESKGEFSKTFKQHLKEKKRQVLKKNESDDPAFYIGGCCYDKHR